MRFSNRASAYLAVTATISMCIAGWQVASFLWMEGGAAALLWALVWLGSAACAGRWSEYLEEIGL